MWVILSGKCISGDDDVTLYVILLGRCISTNLVQRERAQFKQKIAVMKILMIINSGLIPI